MKLFKPTRVAHAHCDLPCGVYDPAQARINAESVVNASKNIKNLMILHSNNDASPSKKIWLKRLKKIYGYCGQIISSQNTLKNSQMFMIFSGMQQKSWRSKENRRSCSRRGASRFD